MNQYKIAGLITRMNPEKITESHALPYRIDDNSSPDIVVNSDIEEMKIKYPYYSDATCEYLASGKSYYRELIRYNGMVLHSSAVMKENGAYLFSAKCGTGKSTHTSLWRRLYGDDAVRILNDDKPALRLEDGVWYAYGTPWSGKTGQNLNLRVPLRGICFLERGVENYIERIHGKEAVFRILDQTSKIKDPELKQIQLDLVLKLLEMVPIWKMACNMDPEAARVSCEAMSGAWKNEE